VDQPADDGGAAGVSCDSGIVGVAVAGGFKDYGLRRSVLGYPGDSLIIIGVRVLQPFGTGEALVVFEGVVIGADGDFGINHDGVDAGEENEGPEEAEKAGAEGVGKFKLAESEGDGETAGGGGGTGKADENVAGGDGEHNESLVSEFEHGVGALMGSNIDIFDID